MFFDLADPLLEAETETPSKDTSKPPKGGKRSGGGKKGKSRR